MKEKYPNKRLLSLVMTLVMVMSLFSVNANAAETLPESSQAALNAVQSGLSYDDFGYKVNSDGATVTITGCSKTDSEITVPSEIDGMAVTAIGKEAFFHCGYTKITLPEGIVTIEEAAFEHSPKLESVNIPSTVTTIEKAAFDGISKLTVVNVPAGVTSIGEWAFHRCSKLTAINVDPSNTNYKSIDGVLFNSDGTELLSYPCGRAEDGAYTVPEGTETIHTYAFHCAKISSLTLPGTLTDIGHAAFSYLSKLESVTIPGNVKNIEKDAFTSCQSLTSITVENGVETIGDEAFSYCGKLQSVFIPQSVTSLGSGALCFCSSLETITVDTGCLCCTVKDGVLFDKDMTTLLCYPAAKADTSYTIPDGVSVIAECSFSNSKNLTDVVIPYGVSKIGWSAFSSCRTLMNINIPNSITDIGSHAFYGCSSLTDIVIPDSVTQLGGSAFSDCKALKNIKLSNNISTIFGSTFNECESLESIVIPESVTEIRDRVFCYCKKLKSITLPSHLNMIDSYCFLCCSSLESITIPEGVKGISYRTFYQCYSLKNVELPSTARGIASEAFINCSSLESITLPVGCKNILPDAFSGCKKLDKIVIPKTVTYISSDAFNNTPNINFYCCMDSYADRYAEEKGIPRVYITDLNLNKTELDLEKGRQFTLTAEITPDSSKDQKVTWTSDNTDVATVENGLVRAKSKGSAVIKAVTEDGTFEECIVNVYVDVIHHEAVPPTCTEDGTIEYWISENKYYKDEALTEQTFDVTDSATGHDWNDPEYTWDDEFNCTAKRTCKNDPSHIEIETVKAEDIVLTYPECENSGTILYTARFENISFVEQKKEETIPAIGHNWSEPQYSWQGDDIPTECEAWRVCENDYEYQTETADVAYRVVSEPTCDGEGIGEYYATFKNPAFTEQVWSEVIPPLGHSYGEPTYTWSDDNKTCTAERICSVDDGHIETETVNTTSEITKKPTCTEIGETTYTAAFANKAFTSQTKVIENIAPLGHSYGEPTYTWSDDNKTCTAKRVCANDDTHIETETVNTTSEITKKPTCTETGETTYTAAFTNKAFTSQAKTIENIAPLGHSYGEPTYTWSDDNKTCTAERICSVDDGHIETETADVTSEITKKPTCEEKGETTYTAAFANKAFTSQAKTIENIAPLGHSYGEPTYTWSDDNKTCTAKRACANDNTHIETETADVTSEITKKPTCTEIGETTYTAVFENTAFEKQTRTENIEPTGHLFVRFLKWVWEGFNRVIAWFACGNDVSHIETIDLPAAIDTVDTPDCTNDGYVYHTATVDVAGRIYTAVNVETLDQLGHSWGEPVWTWDGHDSASAEFVCGHCGGTLTLDAQITTAVTAEPTEDIEGVRTYTAAVTLGSSEYTDEIKEAIPKLEPKPIPEPTPDEPIPEPEMIGLLGDVNGDGMVDSTDALIILRASVQLQTFDDVQNILGDVNSDASVDSTDSLEVLRHSVNLSANEDIGKPVMKKAA